MKSFYKTLYSFSFIIFTITLANASYQPAKEISPGLWVASKMVDGKTLYFALQNKPDSVESFRNFAFNVGSNQNNSSLGNAIAVLAYECMPKNKEACFNSGALEVYQDFGLDTDAKKMEFLDYLYDSNKEMKQINIMMSNIHIGADYIFPESDVAFAWVSTEPITGYRDFGYLGEKIDGNINLDQAIKSNRDIILLISASFSNVSNSKLKEYINVRGIFKPPHELLYGNHTGLSLMFHGFIAHAAKQMAKKVYTVNPGTAMADIFNAAFIKGRAYRGVSASYKDLYYEIDGTTPATETATIAGGQDIFIKTESLEKFFTESQ